MKGHRPSPSGTDSDLKILCLYNQSYAHSCLLLENVFKVSSVAHGPFATVTILFAARINEKYM